MNGSQGVTRDALLAALEALAPLRGAAAWDNVGLLIEPLTDRPVRAIGLTIDLTESVLADLIADGVDAIIAYHPPIFSGLKRIDRATVAGRVIRAALGAGVLVYSPHTALDAADGGMADWLADAMGPARERRALEPSDPGAPHLGLGRRVALATPQPLEPLVARLKDHLGIAHVRVAASPDHQAGAPITIVGVCPGAGGALFDTAIPLDLIVTGELRHHDILAHIARGTSVILTDHTQCERGYLPHFAERLRAALGEAVQIHCARRDRDPLVIT